VVGVNGMFYAFNNMAGQVATLNLANGNTAAVSNFAPDGGLLVQGAASPTPEPGSILMTALGLAALGIIVSFRRTARRRHFTHFAPRGRNF
jgi:PEP-CTERM motif